MFRVLLQSARPSPLVVEGPGVVLHRYGEVASARLRSVPVDLKSKMPRRAAIMKNMVRTSPVVLACLLALLLWS